MNIVQKESNYIDAKLLKNRKDNEMIQAFWKLLARLNAGGKGNSKKHILDNKASAEFKKEIR